MIAVLLGSFILAYIVISLIRTCIEDSKLPPGPIGLPLLGYIPFLGEKQHLTLVQLSKKYGNVFTIRHGSKNVVVANDWKAVKDALSNPALLGRPKGMFGGILKNENVGSGSGPLWREQRRCSYRIFHELGFGKQTMENNIKDEMKYFLQEIDGQTDKPFDVNELLSSTVSNNIAYLLFGHRYDYNDPIRHRINEAFLSVQGSVGAFSQIHNMGIIFSLFKFFNLFGTQRVLDTFNYVGNVVIKEIEEHERRFDENNIKDYIDGYLAETKRRQAENDPANFTIQTLVENARALFGAGSGTVKDTLQWALLLMADKLDIQKKVQKEIDAVVGKDRLTSWADRALMPYTNAVINEIQRWTSMIAITLPRRAMEDTQILGHNIPKGTLVVSNFWQINRDPELWKNPDLFDPSRFLSEDGKECVKPEYLIPFGLGKRNCVGEILARYEIFLYLTSLLQRYEIQLPPGDTPYYESLCGITLRPARPPLFVFKRRM